MIDSTTRLDNTAVLGDKRLLFNYTILKRTEEVRADTVAFQQGVTESLVNMIKTNPRFASLHKADMGFAANWYDDKGNYLCSVLIDPVDYRK